MSKITIVIDESGTLPDPKDKVIIIAAVGSAIPTDLLVVIKKIRALIKPKKKEKQVSEIKFYKAGERTKTIFLKELVKKDIDIFALVVEKNNQTIADTPENFALISYILLEECLLFYKNETVDKIIFDRHFFREKDKIGFNQQLKFLLKDKISPICLDSQENPEISSADMIAGSLLWKYTGKDQRFYDIIKNKIISEKIVNWKEAKRRFFNKTKNPLEPA